MLNKTLTVAGILATLIAGGWVYDFATSAADFTTDKISNVQFCVQHPQNCR